MSPRTRLSGLLVLRPLLCVRRHALRAHLRDSGVGWREDASNVSDAYVRNRVRRLLVKHPALHDSLIDLGGACAALRRWVRANAPRLQARFAAAQLADLPDLLARESARRWLVDRLSPPGKIEPDTIARLIQMTRDSASPARQHFPGRILVRRRRGQIDVEGS
jgi:tRNA(Ile)-lysidine synthase TilS/MesJ